MSNNLLSIKRCPVRRQGTRPCQLCLGSVSWASKMSSSGRHPARYQFYSLISEIRLHRVSDLSTSIDLNNERRLACCSFDHGKEGLLGCLEVGGEEFRSIWIKKGTRSSC